MSLAWETTVEDVENCLVRMGRERIDALKILNSLDHAAIEKAALRGNDMADQVEGAYTEIERQIKEWTTR
jgi:hypothetical protein